MGTLSSGLIPPITHFDPYLHFQLLTPERRCDTYTHMHVSGLFHLRLWPQGASTLLGMAAAYPSLQQGRTPLYF